MIWGTRRGRKECVGSVAEVVRAVFADMPLLRLDVAELRRPGATASKPCSMPLPPAAARTQSAARAASAKPAAAAKSTVPMAKQRSAAGASAIDWQLPSGVRATLERWGPALLQKVTSARAAWLASQRCGVQALLPPTAELHIGTDCSGAQAPIWALKAMGIPHVHSFACDVSTAARRFILASSPPKGPIFDNMLRRRKDLVPKHNLYICGFPCTPFSTLRQHSTKLFGEPAAKPFFVAVGVIREHLPALAILENVMGIQRVMNRVVLNLRALRWYHVVVAPIDSADLGEPVRRMRLFSHLGAQGPLHLDGPQPSPGVCGRHDDGRACSVNGHDL